MESFQTNIFEDSYLDSLPETPIYALKEIISEYDKIDAQMRGGTVQGDVSFYLRALALIERFATASEIEHMVPTKEDLLSLDEQGIPDEIRALIATVSKLCKVGIRELRLRNAVYDLDSYREEFSAFPRNELSYDFSVEDYENIQSLTNELRDLISNSNLLDDNHKARLLSRLEDFQREFHKKMSNLDRFWIFFGEAGVRLGKFGADAKPMLDRLRELAEMVVKISDLSRLLSGGENLKLPGPQSDSDQK